MRLSHTKFLLLFHHSFHTKSSYILNQNHKKSHSEIINTKCPNDKLRLEQVTVKSVQFDKNMEASILKLSNFYKLRASVKYVATGIQLFFTN